MENHGKAESKHESHLHHFVCLGCIVTVRTAHVFSNGITKVSAEMLDVARKNSFFLHPKQCYLSTFGIAWQVFTQFLNSHSDSIFLSLWDYCHYVQPSGYMILNYPPPNSLEAIVTFKSISIIYFLNMIN